MRTPPPFRGRAVVGAVVFAASAACATNPATGKKELVLVSEAQEIEMGRAADREVMRSMGQYPDEAWISYVAEMGLQLARGSERPNLPWKFEVVDDPVVNAFALPGGFVYLTRGILAHMNSEAAMVGVLGHEIGHITARHAVQQISRAQLAGIGLGVGSIAFPEVRPFGDLLETGLGLMFLKFSRDDEREADKLGVRYSLAQGYDAKRMAGFFQVLGRLGARSERSIPTWLSTHPDPEDREQRIIELVRARVAADARLVVREDSFKRRLDGLVVGADPREGFMDGNTFKHPDLRFEIDFPADWEVQNTPQAVFSASPERDAALRLTASRVDPGTSPEQHAVRFFRQNELEFGTGERTRIGRFSAYLAPFRIRSSRGVLIGEAGFIEDDDLVYEILGYAPQRLFRGYRELFLEFIGSFRRLTDRRALAVQPDRLRIVEVDRAMTARDAFLDWGAEEEALSDLALLNNLDLDDRLEAGSLLKTVESGRHAGEE